MVDKVVGDVTVVADVSVAVSVPYVVVTTEEFNERECNLK